jgi:ribosomal protein S8
VIELKFGKNRERVITDLKRVSEAGPPRLRQEGPPPARPRRARHRDPVHVDRRDHHRQAAERGVGGEVIAFVW